MRADINLERIHDYIADLFAAAGLKEEFSHYILSVSCDDDPYHKTLQLNLEISTDKPPKSHPHCISIVTTKSHTFDYGTSIDEFAYQISKMTQALNDTLGNESMHPIPLDLPIGWYRDLYLPKKVDMLDARFWPDVIDYTKFSEKKQEELESLTACLKKRAEIKIRPIDMYPRGAVDDLADMIVRRIDPQPVNNQDYTNHIIFNKGDDTMNFTAEQKKTLDQINLDASAKQAELEADRQKAIEDLKNDAEMDAIRRDLDKLAWKRHTFYQSLIDQGFNSEQAMQILLNEF